MDKPAARSDKAFVCIGWAGIIAVWAAHRLAISTGKISLDIETGLTVLVAFGLFSFVLDAWFGEMTGRRLTISGVIFAGVTVLAVLALIFGQAKTDVPRWLSLVIAIFYALSAVVAFKSD